jgi:hypothetical protein
MAKPDQVRIRVTIISGSPTSRVVVRYRARFTQEEVADNHRSRELIQLFGEDPPAGPAGDDMFFTFPPRVVRPNGQAVRQFMRMAMVPNSVLDEDIGAEEDEIYARVCLRALDDQSSPPSGCDRSPAIST